MDLRRLPAIIWVSLLALIIMAGVVGLALGGLDGEKSVSPHASVAVAEAGDGFSIQ